MIRRPLKKHSFTPWIMSISLCLVLGACQNYPITFNGNRLNSAPLLSGFNLADKHLSACVNEHIFDQKIRKAEQLTELNCAERSIHSLKGLEFFPHLLVLRLNNNPIDSFKPVLALQNLERLEVGNTTADCASLMQLRQKGVKVEGACAGASAQ
ncbi:MAG TPA: hypothetical protein PK011_03565 [Marinagarivorans sp.]|nr:hypothetical protein [Cellvibrionaceae bacterium]HMY38378.1 hypothetical protein [Marinagarivorans sp.]HNG60724.1 hypothetical protein [Cellvibrionaceae bacterium]